MKRGWQWPVLLVAVIVAFFHETLFLGHTLIPTDVLNQLLLPYSRNVEQIAVHNHYTMDVVEQDYPWGQFWQRSVRAGELPLWNPDSFGGQPHLATSMAGVFSPFRLLYLALPAERALSLGIVAGFVGAAVFMFGFLREIGRSPMAAFVGGVAWALNTAMLMWYWRLSSVMAWVPLTLWCFERAQRLNSIPWLMATTLSLALAWLGGNAQSACHVGLICGIYFFATTNSSRGRVVVILALAAALTAIQWLPTLELMHWDVTGRMESAGPRGSLRHTALGLGALITFIFPGLAGSTETFDLLKAVPAGMGDFTGSIGLAASVMAALGFFGARDRRLKALWTAAVLAVALVLFTPLVKYLYHRLLIAVVLAMSVSASYGVDLWLTLPDEKRRLMQRIMRCAIMLGGLLAGGLVIAQLVINAQRPILFDHAFKLVSQRAADSFFGNNPEWLRDRITAFLNHYRLGNPVFWLPLIGLAVVAVAGWRRRGMRTTIMVVSLCELVLLGRMLVPQINQTQAPLYPPLQLLTTIQQTPGLFRVLRYAPNQPTFLPENFLMTYGLSSASGYESLAPANLGSLPIETNGNFNALLDLQNVRFIVCPDSTSLPAPRFSHIAEGDGLRVYRNNTCLPRVQLLTRWETVADRTAARKRMSAPDFRPDEVVLLEQNPGIPTSAPPTGPTVAAIQQYAAQRVIIHTSASQPAILLLADTWYPGWRATVDGQPAELLRADAVLRAVALPAGEHIVEFRYQPTSVRLGAAFSGLALITAVTAAVRYRGRNVSVAS